MIKFQIRSRDKSVLKFDWPLPNYENYALPEKKEGKFYSQKIITENVLLLISTKLTKKDY
jgi:hypothetical protein